MTPSDQALAQALLHGAKPLHELRGLAKAALANPLPTPSHNSRKYLDHLVGLACVPDLMAHRLFPNAKEVTESFAAYEAVATGWDLIPPSEKTAAVYAVGDGHRPRTAATFAFRTAWWCHSVDPQLVERGSYASIQRLRCHRMMVQHLPRQHAGPTILACVHSHAALPLALHLLDPDAPAIVVAMPCCKAQVIPGVPPTAEWRDSGVWSPENRILYWAAPKGRDLQPKGN